MSDIEQKIVDILKKVGNSCANDFDGCVRMGESFKSAGSFDLALDFFKKALEMDPKNANAYWLIGDTYLNGLQDTVKAIEYFKQYVENNPNNALVCNIIGTLYGKIDKYENIDEQITYFNKALEINPDFDRAIRNLAFLYTRLGRNEETTKYFEKLFKLGTIPDDYFAYACHKIKLKDFEVGWRYYEYRFLKLYGKTPYPEDIKKPRWWGEKISDKTLLVQYEQGYGDSMCFFRYLNQVQPLVKKIIFRVQEGLVDLLKSNTKNIASNIEIVGTSVPVKALSFDYHVPLMSLMYLLKARIDNIPFQEGYLKADEAKAEQFKKDYFDNDYFKIGICWNGAKGGSKIRNIPLEVFYPLTKIKGVKVYSFQKTAGAEQLENCPPEIEIIDMGKNFKDFSDTAAAMTNLDLFVTSDNGVFNLAGAMGKETFLLLNKESEWRWFLDEDSTPWYGSVRFFKKKFEKQGWDVLMQRVVEAVSEKLIEK